ncbi:hypothetical protein D9V41_03005 [Aeromicrobium phragmitis]|uniref:Uncharacterized protein n=1 Tax=Aeromicrobium phragmitis TaxID=2478914 RepID=A0A3L8PN20_9ACTN|nr:hypothetical protein [Aeromicrobium phragmitis]RLV56765.1 hypothetical protein D9V41_03005 [Aeromicrobium phragmitis]
MPDDDDVLDATEAIARLERWETHGGAWQVLDDGKSTGRTRIALLRCDGGEEVDRLESADADVFRWLVSRGGASD